MPKKSTGRRTPPVQAKAKASAKKAKAGRPSDFTQDTADAICAALMSGKSLRSVCPSAGIPTLATVMRWLEKYPAFREQYARAREAQAEILADQIIDIADDVSGDTLDGDGGETPNAVAVQRAKLRVDARKWFASKLAPKKYGDRTEVEHSGQVAHSHTHLTLEELRRRVAASRANEAPTDP